MLTNGRLQENKCIDECYIMKGGLLSISYRLSMRTPVCNLIDKALVVYLIIGSC